MKCIFNLKNNYKQNYRAPKYFETGEIVKTFQNQTVHNINRRKEQMFTIETVILNWINAWICRKTKCKRCCPVHVLHSGFANDTLSANTVIFSTKPNSQLYQPTKQWKQLSYFWGKTNHSIMLILFILQTIRPFSN